MSMFTNNVNEFRLPTHITPNVVNRIIEVPDLDDPDFVQSSYIDDEEPSIVGDISDDYEREDIE